MKSTSPLRGFDETFKYRNSFRTIKPGVLHFNYFKPEYKLTKGLIKRLSTYLSYLTTLNLERCAELSSIALLNTLQEQSLNIHRDVVGNVHQI
jgi:hypothetical protein